MDEQENKGIKERFRNLASKVAEFLRVNTALILSGIAASGIPVGIATIKSGHHDAGLLIMTLAGVFTGATMVYGLHTLHKFDELLDDIEEQTKSLNKISNSDNKTSRYNDALRTISNQTGLSVNDVSHIINDVARTHVRNTDGKRRNCIQKQLTSKKDFEI